MKEKLLFIGLVGILIGSVAGQGCKSGSGLDDNNEKNSGGAPKGMEGKVSIHTASRQGEKGIVEELLAKGTDINGKDERGMTPLHWAAVGEHKNVVELLISKGAEVDGRNDGGWTPLFNAAMEGNKELTALLIQRGANVNARGNDNTTALHYTAGNAETAVVKLLLSKGADANLRDDKGKTPLDWVSVRLGQWHRHPVLARRLPALKATAQLLRDSGAKAGNELN